MAIRRVQGNSRTEICPIQKTNETELGKGDEPRRIDFLQRGYLQLLGEASAFGTEERKKGRLGGKEICLNLRDSLGRSQI